MTLFQRLFTGYMAQAEDGGSAGGAPVDRGDTLAAGAPEVKDAVVENPLPDDPVKAEAEAGAGDKEDPEDKDKEADGKDPHIPLSRHKAILERERQKSEAIAVRLSQLEKGGEVAKTNDVLNKAEEKLVGLENNYTKLLADGELDKAATAMKEIRQLERSINDQIMQDRLAEAEANAVERARFDIVAERLEAAYPQLNPLDEAYDKDAVAEVLEMKRGYELQGYASTAALQKAVAKQYPAQTTKQEVATTVTPRVDKDDVAKKRQDDARLKAIAAQQKTPASTKSVGMDSDKVGGGIDAENVMKMSQDEFARLDEAALAKMRGDTL